MTDVFETRVENLEPKEDKKISSAATKKKKDQKFLNKPKKFNSDSIVIESSEESSV